MAVGFIIATFFSIIILFGPKSYYLSSGMDMDENFSIVKVTTGQDNNSSNNLPLNIVSFFTRKNDANSRNTSSNMNANNNYNNAAGNIKKYSLEQPPAVIQTELHLDRHGLIIDYGPGSNKKNISSPTKSLDLKIPAAVDISISRVGVMMKENNEKEKSSQRMIWIHRSERDSIETPASKPVFDRFTEHDSEYDNENEKE